MNASLPRRGAPGFTMLELLVILAIVGILLVLALLGIQSAREASRRAACVNNLKQIGLAIHAYESNHGTYPIGALMNSDFGDFGCNREPFFYSLFASILPQIGATHVYNAINFNFPAAGHYYMGLDAGAINRTGLITRMSVYICPADSRQVPIPIAENTNAYSQSSYAGSAGTYDIWTFNCGCPPSIGGFSCRGSVQIASDGVFYGNVATTVAAIADGTSSTIAVGETARFNDDPDPNLNTWTRAAMLTSRAGPDTMRAQGTAATVPRMNAPLLVSDRAIHSGSRAPTGEVNAWLFLQSGFDGRAFGQFGFRSQHSGGANFLFCDGAVRFLKESIDMGSADYFPPGAIGVYRALSTRAGHEALPRDAY
jgi:prepilin-type processing-associated H-X9-DG protein